MKEFVSFSLTTHIRSRMKKQSQNDVDIAALLAKIQEQLHQLDRKVDSLLSKPLPPPKPSQQPSVAQRPPEPQKLRQMYQATCADCKKDCEVPFKPTGDRPVYCQECFRQRKAIRTLKPASPPEKVVSAATGLVELPAKEKKRPVAVKKTAPKRKPAAKKK
jgi:CxxC-x17-CxxC domain-containing protein